MKLQHFAKVISKNITVLSIASAFALGAFGMSDLREELLDTSKWFKPQPETEQTKFENIAENADANPFEKDSSGLPVDRDESAKESSSESTTELTTTTTTEATTTETSDPSEDSSLTSDTEEPEATASATKDPSDVDPSDETPETTKKKKETKESKKETTEAPKDTTTNAPTDTTAAPTETTAAPTETTAAPTKPAAMGDTSGSYNDGMASEVLTLVNNERAANGLAPLSWSNSLAKAAKTRATEIVVTWSHSRPDGSEWYTVSDVTYGENLAKGQSSASSAMTAWMNSADHRNNILMADYKTLGVACYACNGKYYWVQEFGY
ncbi:MAG: CAP domain-containing protein [Clostridiales bacterium]|nr:CAP domain-containing protein [Clostridiales bacterium]